MTPGGSATHDPVELQASRLRRLHDALAPTPISGRYWVCGGVLLGWAREGQLLSHDALDADFNYRSEDAERLEASLPALLDAGFRLARRFPNVDEVPTQWAVSLDDAIFDFFCVQISGERLRWSNYGTNTDRSSPHTHVQNICEIPALPLAEFRFLDRYWLKPDDHEAELTSVYGDWRTPDPGYDYMRGPAIIECRPWDPSRYRL
ncbi:MAG: hypothetical protein ABSG64_06825 [Solirubrobacteraceae bacterium]|jgi:hypothetical protein